MRKFLLAVMITLLAGTIAFAAETTPTPTPTSPPTTTPAKVFQWKNFVSSSPGDFGYKQWGQFNTEVEKRSGGRIKIQPQFAGEVPYKSADETIVVRDRLVDTSRVLALYVDSTNPILGLPGLPWLLPSQDKFWAMMNAFRPYAEAEFKKWNQIPVFVSLYPWQQIWVKDPIAKLADLKGRKIRAAGALGGHIVTVLGGTPLTVQFGEVYTALQRGTVDGAITSAGSVKDMKWYEVSKYGVKANVNVAPMWYTINLAAWNELPSDLQKVILDVGKEIQSKMYDAVLKNDEDVVRSLAKDFGVKIIDISQQNRVEQAKAWEAQWQTWAEKIGPEAVDALKKVRAAVGR